MTGVLAASAALSPVIDQLHDHVVAVQDGNRGGGAGVVWRTGVIITNAHVVQGTSPIVHYPDGASETAQVVARNDERDLAALQVESSLPPAPIGDSRKLRTGEIVLAIGHPLGVEGAVTFGVVSRPAQPGDRDVIASSIYLNRGNSGGPLANARGQVVGINAMVLTPGIGLSIPAYIVQVFLDQSLGPAARIGITAQQVAIPVSYHYQFGLTASDYLLIAEVEPGSPADEAGLLPGDLILTAGRHDITTPEYLLDEIRDAAGSGEIELTVLRGGSKQTFRSRVMTKT